LTTDSAEQDWTDDLVTRYAVAPVSSSYSGISNYDNLPDGYQTITFDLSSKSDWNDRIITALRFELINAQSSSDMKIETDINYIKIAVKE